jgi:hypothetical protein
LGDRRRRCPRKAAFGNDPKSGLDELPAGRVALSGAGRTNKERGAKNSLSIYSLSMCSLSRFAFRCQDPEGPMVKLSAVPSGEFVTCDMDDWIPPLLAALALPKFGLSTVFVIAFVSATLLPMGSEPAVFGLVKLNPDLFWPAVLVATAGNTLGGALTWWMGYGRSRSTNG